MIKLNQARTVMVDIDDTCILWEPEKYPHNEADLIILEDDGKVFKFLPHFKHIEFIRKLKLQGFALVFWSAGGNDWCERIVKLLELDGVADICMSKPEFAVDDLLDARRIIKTVLWIDPISGEYRRNE